MTQHEALARVYLQTTYRVITAAKPVDIRIGVLNPALADLLQSRGARTWAFLTASNPRSQQLTDDDNALRNDKLMQSLRDEGWSCLDAVGVPDNSDWMPEQSVLILGIGRRAALALARRWQQNAIVYGEHGVVPELVWAD